MFGRPPAPAQPNPFLAQSSSMSTGAFQAPSPFQTAVPAAPTTGTTSNPFAALSTTTFQSTSSAFSAPANPFAQAAPPSSFASPMTGTPSAPVSTGNMVQSAFAQAPAPPQTSVFQTQSAFPARQQPAPSTPAAAPFGQVTTPATSVFGQATSSTPAPAPAARVFSDDALLSDSDRREYAAAEFTRIPFLPPSSSMV